MPTQRNSTRQSRKISGGAASRSSATSGNGRPDDQPALIDVFDSRLGWFGLQYSGRTVKRIQFGFQSADEVLRSAQPSGELRKQASPADLGWRAAIQAFAAGERVSFSDWEIDISWMTPFQEQVIAACRRIASGNTTTYGMLATSVGSPGAARAVGSVMRTNRFPIVVPCHRVIGSNGIGGFSASDGVTTKRRLLELERATGFSRQTQMQFD